MFRNLRLSTKLLLTFVPLFLLLIGDTYYLDTRGQEEAMLAQAKSSALEKAHIVRASLVQQMLENEKVDDVYLESLRRVGGLQDLYIRINPDQLRLRDWLVDSTRTARLNKRAEYAQAKGELGNDVFTTGNSLFVNRDDAIEAIIPFKAEKKCQSCHNVPVNTVLGVAHIQLPMGEIKAAIKANTQRTALISISFAVITLVIGGVSFRFLVQKPVKTLVGATEAIAEGNLNHDLGMRTSNDEIGILAQSFDRMRKALKQSQEALRTSAVGQIANSLIRDFRAPIRQVLAAVEQLEKPGTDPAVRAQQVETARNSVMLMNKMTQDLLDFTTGDLKINKQSCKVPSLVAYVAEMVKADLERDSVRFEVRQGYQGNCLLDYERIARALMNLVIYSVNYVPPGGTIQLSTSTEGTSLKIVVQDNGSGIPAQFRSRIFEPFTKIVQEKGVGLGMALSKRIIESQGGTIDVGSAEGKGTTFSITLPLA